VQLRFVVLMPREDVRSAAMKCKGMLSGGAMMFIYTVKDVFQTIIVGLVLLAIVVPFGGAAIVDAWRKWRKR
jgi:hypothetical protein